MAWPRAVGNGNSMRGIHDRDGRFLFGEINAHL